RVPVHVGRRVDEGRRAAVARRLEPDERVLEQRPLVVAGGVALPPEHVLAWVVVHLALLAHVEDTASDRELLFRQRRFELVDGPGPVIAVIPKAHVRVLRREERASLAVRQDLEYPV